MKASASAPVPPVRDLDDHADVAEMVVRFYRLVAMDDLLGPMFNDVAKVDWGEHLPKLTAFWCRALFSTPGYEGNPYRAHQLVHAKAAFTAAHFERWLDLFEETIDAGWVGPNVERAKALAHKVARVHGSQLIDRPSRPLPERQDA
jgi:hemoglobin